MKTGSLKQNAFNPAQLEVIKTLSFVKTKKVTTELKNVIAKHFAGLIEEEMDKLWESGEMNNSRNNEIANTHLRTPYKK